MALRTSNGTGGGDWGTAATWDTGVPVDTDTFLILNGDTVTFNVDQSAMGSGMGASTINATGTLIASTTAGSYYLKMNGDLTLTGTLQAGTSAAVPYPSTCIFTIGFNSGSNSIVINDATGRLYLYCTEPTIRYMALSAAEAAGQTILSVDDDVTGDIWKAGDIICIADFLNPGVFTRDSEERVIAAGGIAATTITVTAAITNAKTIGAKVILISRNIRLINSTDYAIKTGKNCYIAAEIYNCTGGGIFGTDDSTIGGAILIPSTLSASGINTAYSITFAGVISQIGSTGYAGGITGCSNVNITSVSLITGFWVAVYQNSNVNCSGEISSNTYGIYLVTTVVMTGNIKGCYSAIRQCSNVWFTGQTFNVTQSFDGGSAIFCNNAQLGNSIGGLTSTQDFSASATAVIYNTLFQATTEFLNYNNATNRMIWNYVESLDHDQVANAYKAWCLGGIVTSQTVGPPTGYSIWYELACESATYPVFRQYQVTVKPDETLNVEGLIRIADAEDHTAYPPRLQIIDFFADPLVDDTQSPLDEDQVAVYDGSDSSWQEVVVSYVNQGDSDKIVLVRMIAKHATGDVDTVWTIPATQEKLDEIINRLKRIGVTNEY